MVKKFFGMLTREVSGVHNAAYILAFFTLLSQILALARDRLFAHHFGAGEALDIYYAAFKIPDLIFISIASFVSISVLVPFIINRLEGDRDELKRFTSSLFSFFLLLVTLLCIITYALAPALLRWLFPGIEGTASLDLASLTRIMLLSPILLGASNFFASITQAYKRFVIYAISPLFYNIGIIAGIVFFYPRFGLAGLAWGVVLGASVHLLLQIPFVYGHRLMPRIRLSFDFASIREVVTLSIGRTIALSSSAIATIFLLTVGSLMSKGSIAVFNLSWNIQSVPLAIVGASYSIALFPTISKYFSLGDRAKFVSEMLAAAKHIIFWSLPITILFIVLRAQVVRTILGTGEFSWQDTRLVAASLAVFSVSVVAQSLVLLFVRAYYASGRTKAPLLVNVFSGIAAALFSFGFWKLFQFSELFRYFMESLLRVGDIAGTEVIALPLGYSISMLLNVALFWYLFHREVPGFSNPLLKVFFQSFSASIIMGFVSYLVLQWLSTVFDLDTLAGIFLQGFFAGAVGITVCILMLYALKSRELSEVWQTLHGRIWKTKVIVSEETL